MFYKNLFLVFVLLIVGCAFTLQPHPANNYFKSLKYPIIGMNQINSKYIKENPQLIQELAKYDLVIINKAGDLFVDGNSDYSIARQIKAINPKVKVLQYLNMSDIWTYQSTYKDWAANHPEAVLKDDNGQPIHPYSNLYGKKRIMMDPNNEEWQNYYAARMKKIVDQGMDGIFIDNIWRSNWEHLNISPQRFTQSQQGWEKIMQKGRQEIGPDRIIIGNSPPYELYQTRDITMIEGRLKPDENSLRQYLKMSQEGESYGQLTFDTIKNGAMAGNGMGRIYGFYLPAVLLTDNIWGISYEPPENFIIVKKIGKIGRPLGKMKRYNGVLSRDYTTAKVLLNDTGETKTVSLASNTYVTLDNEPVNSVTLDPLQGIVLKKTK